MGPVPNCVDCLDQARCLENVLPIPPPPRFGLESWLGLGLSLGLWEGGGGWV